MALTFVTSAVVEVNPPTGAAFNSTDFALSTTMDGVGFQFEFSWNGKHGYYAVGIVRSDDKRIAKLYPETGEWNLVRNFHHEDADNPDAFIGILDVAAVGGDANPANLGDTHRLVMLRGRVVDL